MKNEKYCIDCANIINTKPQPRCEASRFTDMVTGDKKRLCLVERLDGLGRCGTMGNNFSPKPPVEKKKPGPKPKDA